MRLSHAIPGFEAGSRPRSKNLPLVPEEGFEPPRFRASS